MACLFLIGWWTFTDPDLVDFFCWHWSSCSLRLVSFWLGAGHVTDPDSVHFLVGIDPHALCDWWAWLLKIPAPSWLSWAVPKIAVQCVCHASVSCLASFRWFSSSSCGSTLDLVSPPWCWNNLKCNTMKSGKFTPSCLITPACFYLIQMIPNKAAIQGIVTW